MTNLAPDLGSLRVVRLEAENFKRLKAVDITPDPDAATVTIAGRNAQGKSSVIDAIWAALANAVHAKGAGTVRPIRDGETHARVTVDLGDLIVERVWTGDRTHLTVSSPDGARYTSPQRMLDDLIGRLSFDPLAFAQLPAKQQQIELLGLVDLPFNPDDLAAIRAAKFAERTEVGRTRKELSAQLAGLPPHNQEVGVEEQSAAELFGQLQSLRAQSQKHAALMRIAAAAETNVGAALRAVADAQRRLAESEAARDEARVELAATPEPNQEETELLESQIRHLDATNAAARANQERIRVAEALTTATLTWDSLSADLVNLDNRRADGLAAAAFPIDGLGFDDDGVTYNGVPLTQASAAEQLRVSVAIAMALNPTVRVIRITDGSLLDSDNLALIGAMAADRGYQVWIETVRDVGVAGPGVVIEDGQVQ